MTDSFRGLTRSGRLPRVLRNRLQDGIPTRGVGERAVSTTSSAAAGARATLKDVARVAGVHPGTASRALNVETRDLVNEDTARRVLSAAERLGYRPNPIARGLAERRSDAGNEERRVARC